VDIFSAVKDRLNVKDVAEYYGLSVNRSGFTNCLFHEDKTPSMKLYNDHFHCFSCCEHGSVIDLTARLFNLKPLEAARKLAQDFGITADNRRKPKIKDKITYYTYVHQENRAFDLLSNYCVFLEKCRKDYAPKIMGETLHPMFTDSLENLDKFKYYRDLFFYGTKDERIAFIKDFSGVLTGIERELQKVKRARQAVEMA